jgi:hypothetical protein
MELTLNPQLSIVHVEASTAGNIRRQGVDYGIFAVAC